MSWSTAIVFRTDVYLCQNKLIFSNYSVVWWRHFQNKTETNSRGKEAKMLICRKGSL